VCSIDIHEEYCEHKDHTNSDKKLQPCGAKTCSAYVNHWPALDEDDKDAIEAYECIHPRYTDNPKAKATSQRANTSFDLRHGSALRRGIRS
jgi:hypothetical protein